MQEIYGQKVECINDGGVQVVSDGAFEHFNTVTPITSGDSQRRLAGDQAAEQNARASMKGWHQDVGTAASLTPVLGPAKQAYYNVKRGEWVQAGANAIVAATDVFLVKDIASAGIKLGAERGLLNKERRKQSKYLKRPPYKKAPRFWEQEQRLSQVPESRGLS